MTQMPTAPRKFYVTAVDGQRVHFLAGPYDTLEAAEAAANIVRNIAYNFNQNATAGRDWFMSYGVSRTIDGRKTSLGVK